MDEPNRHAMRGNRFFLPKIEYSRVESHPKLESDFDLTSYREGVKNDEESKGFERFENPSNTSKRTAAAFTKFSVLPPIRHNGTTQGKYFRDLDKTKSDDRFGPGLELDGRKRSNSLRRQTALWHGEREATAKIDTGKDDLHTIDQRYTGISFYHNRENDSLLARRPSSTPHISTTTTTDIITAQHGVLHRMHRFTKFKRIHSESSKDKNPVQPSAFMSSNDHLSPVLVHDVNDGKRKVSTSGLQVDFVPFRPVSRCHIDINVTKANRTSEQNDESRRLSTKLNTNSQPTISRTSSPSKPIIQISDDVDTNNNDENNNNNDNNINTNDSGPPSIQILIDTLETAKNEIPDKLELPKMSVREQRRRSALCRVDSKQVDDFLLVHNLKDLGLL